MREPSLNGSCFPAAWCEVCDRTVLTHVGLDEDDRETRRCVHCDSAVGPELQWVTADELEAEGYYFGAPPEPAGGECGSGCATCGMRRQ